MRESTLEDNVTFYTRADHADFASQVDRQNSLLHLILKKDTQDLISNIKTEVIIASIENDAWLVTINEKEYHNAMTCSPYSTYINYPKEILSKFRQRWLRGIVFLFPRLFGLFFKLLKINKVIQINNNLTPATHYSPLLCNNICNLLKHLLSRYKNYAILLPRLNNLFDEKLMSTLASSGFIILKKSITHFFDPADEYIKRTDLKKDLELLEKSNYQIVTHEQLTTADLERMHRLYKNLYIEKHTLYNPDLTQEYFYHSHQNNWQYYAALRNVNGSIDAFTSWIIKDNVMTATYCGYDVTQPQETGLYRMIIALSLQYAYDNKYLYNLGAGADQFKLNRGSKKIVEYAAVYYAHLPFYRQLPWRIVAWFTNKFIHRILRQNNF